MKNKRLLATVFLSAAVAAGSIAVPAHAAEAGTVRELTGGCYKVYIGQGTESLSRLLEKICTAMGNGGNLCPETPAPETPIPPIAENPGVQEPDMAPSEGEAKEEDLSYGEQIVKLVNEERAKAGLATLTVDKDITAAANVRAKEITQKFAHTRPDGSSFSSALKEQGVVFRGSGENIAWGQKSPRQVMEGWMNSEGHRANILNANFKNIGVGHYRDDNGVNYWVQLFTY
ncbi:MAG: CAP domain-containing protein [Lachnospiraceae bacterium]|nr:CAP domain-containing protein [Lachnospiraceae bacterium]